MMRTPPACLFSTELNCVELNPVSLMNQSHRGGAYTVAGIHSGCVPFRESCRHLERRADHEKKRQH